MSTSLIKRAEEQIALWQLLEETGGELTPTMEVWLNEISTNLMDKVDGYKVVLDDLETESTRLKERAKGFQDAARSIDGIQAQIKDRMKAAMTIMGVDEVSGQDYRFKLSRVKPALVIVQDELPESYLMEVRTLVPDKDRLRADLETGGFIPGARFEQNVALRAYVNKKGAK